LDFHVLQEVGRAGSSTSRGQCPLCKLALLSIVYPNTSVEIDCCAQCKGTWLDSGEFEKILDELLREVDTKPFPDYIQATLQQAKEIVTGPETLLSEWKDFATVFWLMQLRLLAELETVRHDAENRGN
jgi:Zn-finger nucleic acid-binding protein